eukprot:Rmarinus@m.19225
MRAAWIWSLIFLHLVAVIDGGLQFFVSNDGNDTLGCGPEHFPCNSLKYALRNLMLVSGDEVILFAGIYSGSENLGADMNWLGDVQAAADGNRTLTIRGKERGARDKVIFDGEGKYQAVHLDETSELDMIRFVDLAFRNCHSFTSNGGAVYIDSHPCHFENIWFYQNQAHGGIPLGEGGAVYIRADTYSTSITFRNCLFEENFSEAPGGALMTSASSHAVFEHCVFANNSASTSMWGGAILIEDESDLLFSSCVFYNNTASYGGAIDDGGTVRGLLKDCVFEANRAKYGAAYYSYQNSALIFRNTSFVNNVADQGGGAVRTTAYSTPEFHQCIFKENMGLDGSSLFVTDDSTALVSNSIFTEHSSDSSDSLIHVSSSKTLTLRNSIFAYNNMHASGLISAMSGSIDIDNCNFSYNSGSKGAVIQLLSPGREFTYTVRNSRFEENTAETDGALALIQSAVVLFDNVTAVGHYGKGATILVEQNSVVTIKNSEFLNNTASAPTSSSGHGGVIAVNDEGSIEIDSCIFRYNEASGNGGVFFSDDEEGWVSVHNVTFEGNMAGEKGGALYIGGSGNLSDIIVSNNRANHGGGVYIFTGHREVPNSLSYLTIRDNEAFFGGGGVYFGYSLAGGSGGGRETSPCVGCVIKGNTAQYGNEISSAPYEILIVSLHDSEVMRGETLNITVAILDAFGQVVVDDSFNLDAILKGSDGLDIVTPRSMQKFLEGYAIFDSVEVTGTVNVQYTLNFTCEGVKSTDASLRISFVPCQPGYEEYSRDGLNYVCRPCEEGTYNPYVNSICADCPRHGYCPGEQNGTEVLASRHTWLDPETLPSPTLYACMSDYCCPDSRDPPCPYYVPCKKNREGMLCAECVDGYSEWGGECVSCEEGDAWVACLLVIYCVAVLLMVLLKPPRRKPEGKIAIFALQTMSVIAVYSRRYSLRVVELAGALSFNTDMIFELAAKGRCLFRATAIGKRIFDLLSPLALCALIGIFYLLRVSYARRLNQPVSPVQEHYVRAFLVLISFLSMPLSQATFSLLRCMDFRGESVLVVSPTSECFGVSWVVAFLVLVFVVFGYPLFVVTFLYRNRHNLYDKNGQPHPAYGMLYAPYRRECYLTDPIYLLRRTVVALFVVVLSGDEYHIWRACVVCFLISVMIVVQAIVQPYRDPTVNAQEIMWLSLVGLLAVAEALTAAADTYPDPDVFEDEVRFLLQLVALGSLFVFIFVLRVFMKRALAEASERFQVEGAVDPEETGQGRRAEISKWVTGLVRKYSTEIESPKMLWRTSESWESASNGCDTTGKADCTEGRIRDVECSGWGMDNGEKGEGTREFEVLQAGSVGGREGEEGSEGLGLVNGTAAPGNTVCGNDIDSPSLIFAVDACDNVPSGPLPQSAAPQPRSLSPSASSPSFHLSRSHHPPSTRHTHTYTDSPSRHFPRRVSLPTDPNGYPTQSPQHTAAGPEPYISMTTCVSSNRVHGQSAQLPSREPGNSSINTTSATSLYTSPPFAVGTAKRVALRPPKGNGSRVVNVVQI